MPFAVAGIVGTGISAGVSSGAASDAEKAQKEAAEFRFRLANQAKSKYFKEQQPYVQFGYEQLPVYSEALRKYAEGIPGYFDRLSDYDKAVADYRNLGISGVDTAMGQYQGALGRYQGAVDQYGRSVDQYGNAIGMYSAAIPEMTRAYDMEQYRQSPLYTPMVRNLAELQATPGYQFQLQQGQQALGQTAAARGGLLSGAQQKAAQNYAQQQAATGFQSAWERAQNAYTRAFEQNLQRQRQLGDVLSQNAGLYGTQAGLYERGAGLAGAGAELYGTGVNQAVNRAGLYQNAAAMAGTGAGLYGQGLDYRNQEAINRLNALKFGYGALQDKNAMRRWGAELSSGAATDYGNAQAQGSLAQGQILNSAIGQGLSGIGGFGTNMGWWSAPK